MSLIKEQLREYLNTGDIITLAKAERQVSFITIFETKRKPFCNVQNERELLQSIMKLTQRFISVNFPDVNAQDVALQFAVDITDSRPDWNMLDILNFFKFIRQRQDLPENKIFGNKINPIKLMELTAVYEEQKSIAREQWMKTETSKQLYSSSEDRLLLGSGGENELPKDSRFCDLAKKILSNEKQKSEKIYENTKRFLQDLERHWESQIELVKSGNITEEEAIINHQKYRLDY